MAEEYLTAEGKPLGRGTQATRLAGVKAYYRWLEQHDHLAINVALPIVLPAIPTGPVAVDSLTLQEATALLQTKAARAASFPVGTEKWADQIRALALLTLAIATGRRRSGLRSLRVTDVDSVLNEVRVAREKGRPGRVLPAAPWAVSIVRFYIERARPVLNWHPRSDWLFVGDLTPCIGRNTIQEIITRAHAETVEANPDLMELADKHLTPHCLRKTFASLLFQGAASLRAINELMLHEQLGTTATYTQVSSEALHRACLTAHPRA